MAPLSKRQKVNNRKNRSHKVHLVFDEEKRKEFLTGFRKRKLQRKKKAQEEFEKQLKEERKRLKSEAKESYKKLVQSYKSVPEVEHLLVNEYEEDDVTVEVFELSTNEIAKQNHWIGANEQKYESPDELEDLSQNDGDDETQEAVPGMELQSKVTPKVKSKSSESEFKTEKDVKKELKRQATKNVKKSKVFQRKEKIERNKQKKKSLQQKKLKLKHQKGMKDRRKGKRGGK